MADEKVNFDDLDMAKAMAGDPQMGAGGGGGGGGGGDNRQARTAKELEAVYDIPVTVSAVLGKATMQVNQLLKLGRGAVVELDRKVGEAIDIYVNNRLVARGEVVVVDERLGVTMTEIVKVDRS
jgi:flagellar motor switch protein FliN/FliY